MFFIFYTNGFQKKHTDILKIISKHLGKQTCVVYTYSHSVILRL